MNINDIIPNPLDPNSTNESTAGKIITLKSLMTIPKLLQNIVILVIIAIGVTIYFNIPYEITLVFLAFELFGTVVLGLIKIAEVQSYLRINQDDVKGFREILLKSELWDALHSIVNLFLFGVSVFLIYNFFNQELKILATNSNEIIRTLFSDGNLVFLVVTIGLFSLLGCIVKIFRYNRIKQIEIEEDFASYNQKLVLIYKKFDLLTIVPILGVFPILYILGIPFWILAIFIIFVFLFVVIAIVEIRNIEKVDIKQRPITRAKDIVKLENETVVAAFYGMLRTASGVKDFLKPSSQSVLGVGVNNYPENALFITNNRLIFAAVPLTGGSNVVDGLDYTMQNIMFNRGELISKGKRYETEIDELLKIAVFEVRFEEIKRVEIESAQIKILLTNGDVFAYSFFDREYEKQMVSLLSEFNG